MTDPEFGAFAPSPSQARWRAHAHRLPHNYWGRKAASLLLGPAGGRSGRAFDVSVFKTQRARLHPADNICEKRVYLTPQHWDPAERAALGRFIGAAATDDFVFADIGSNVGLYTLFVRAECLDAGKRLRGLCVEADPEMRTRLDFNLRASGADNDVKRFAGAAAAQDGEMRFHINRDSRGMSRLAEDGEVRVEARTILRILTDAGFPRVDAMKIDIEGAEYEALKAFFGAAPRALQPSMLILETSHEAADRSAARLARECGYELALQTRLNAVLVREGRNFAGDLLEEVRNSAISQP